jgi:2-amino-4-hydroxy-6-hydroxymethyldihydropteridine diphosphokinase
MTLAALSIGSNLGDRESCIDSMERELGLILADTLSSRLMETEPVGVCGRQSPYLNKIIVGYYAGAPYRLLDECLAIESRLGRVRASLKGPRTADIDILLFGDLQIDEKALVIPHPELLNRRFCLEGLMSINPGIRVPFSGGGLTVGELYKNMGTEVAVQNVFFIMDGDGASVPSSAIFKKTEAGLGTAI